MTDTPSNNMLPLYNALAAFQAARLRPLATQDGQHNKFVPLDELLDLITGPLLDAGLLLFQTTERTWRDAEPPIAETVLVTKLVLISNGTSIDSIIPIKPEKADPQAIGSCITYMRRYVIMTLLGLAPYDDDGAAASPRERPSGRREIEPAGEAALRQVYADIVQCAVGWAKAFGEPGNPEDHSGLASTLIRAVLDEKQLAIWRETDTPDITEKTRIGALCARYRPGPPAQRGRVVRRRQRDPPGKGGVVVSQDSRQSPSAWDTQDGRDSSRVALARAYMDSEARRVLEDHILMRLRTAYRADRRLLAEAYARARDRLEAREGYLLAERNRSSRFDDWSTSYQQLVLWEFDELWSTQVLEDAEFMRRSRKT